MVDSFWIVIGVAIAVALAVWLYGRNAPTARRIRGAAVGLVVAAGVAGAAVYGPDFLKNGDEESAVDQAVAEARAMPLVGPVLDDVPGAEARLRTALREELRNPTTQGAPRPLTLMSELRATYIVPAMKAADTSDAMAVLAARNALMRHLRATDVVICRELAVTGIQRGDRLDITGQKLMRDMLAAIEKAYRSGRAAIAAVATAERPVTADTEVRGQLTEAGLTPGDFDKLQRIARLSSDEACDLAIRLNEAPGKLPVSRGGPLARYLAAAQ